MSSKDVEIEAQPLEPKSPATITAEPCAFLDLLRPLPVRFQALYLVGVLHGMVTGVIYSVMIVLMGKIFEESEDHEDLYEEARKVAVIWLALGIVVLYTGYVACYCLSKCSQQVGRAFKGLFLHSALHKDSAYFDSHNASEVVVRLNRDGELVEAGTGDKCLKFVEIGSFCLVSAGLGFLTCPQLFLVGLAVVPVGLVGNALFGYGLMAGAKKKEEVYVKAGAISEESLCEIKTVAAFNAQSFLSTRYNEELRKPSSVTATMGTIKGIGWGLISMEWFLLGAVIYWVASKWISDGRKNWIFRDKVEGADVVVVYWLTAFFFINLGQLAPGIQAVLEAKMAGGRILSFIREPSGLANGSRRIVLEGRVEFREVLFAYPTQSDRFVLRGLSFTCERGEKTAIVGESGAGKSTIIQLMERFYEPSAGQILYDGVNVAEMDIGYLRRQVGYVGQEPVLFNMSILDNIQLGNLEATAEEVEAAAREAQAYEFIASLPAGFQTEVGLKGSKLSGGQKQRIAIARAIIKKPKILLLDEATSALDNTTEAIVLRALNEIHLRQGITMISVAQKLSTIQGSDKIVVLKDGRVEENGTHESLLAQEGLYAQMCTAQASSRDESTQEEKDSEVDRSREEPRQEVETKSSVSAVKTLPLLRVLGMMAQYWPLLLTGVVATVVAGCLYPGFGYFLGKLSTYICGPAGSTMEHNVRKLCLWLLLISVVTLITYSVASWAFSELSAKVVELLRRECFWKLLHLDAPYFDSAPQAHLLAQSLHSDVERTNDAGGALFATVLILLVSYFGMLVLGLFWQWKLTLVVMVTIPIQSFCSTKRKVTYLEGSVHPLSKQAAALAQDSILNMKTLRALEVQTEMETRYDLVQQRAIEASSADIHYNGLMYSTGIATLFGGFAAAFWYGAYLIKNDEAELVDMNIVTFASSATAFGIALTSIFAPSLIAGAQAAERIYAMIDYQPSINVLSAEGVTTPLTGTVEFRNVSFKYVGRDNMVLQKVSFSVSQGGQMGLTGASGSGKTTITQLLLRLYDPTEGQILINGVEIRQYNLKHLRAHIALVGQEPVLFSGSVRSNVDFGLGRSDEEIREALRQAAIPKFAEELDREVGSRGSAVSGGQKQRIAIARAILRDPQILLLDEATSALDSKTEAKILQALDAVGRGRTVLVVAHRLTTIEQCGQIVVLDGGQVVERGSHQELSAVGGAYAKLLKISTK